MIDPAILEANHDINVLSVRSTSQKGAIKPNSRDLCLVERVKQPFNDPINVRH